MTLLILIIIATSGLYIYTNFVNNKLQYFFKPITTVLIILIAINMQLQSNSVYGYLIIAGLVFSLFGDIFLMLPTNKFVQGLVSFLVAHLFYITAFSIGFGPYLEYGYLIPSVVYTIAFLLILLPKTGKMKIPVLVYALVLMVFLWQATGRFYYLSNTSALYTFVGAFLFVISDSILAYARFANKFKLSQLLIHVTYWGAQVFIALSV